MKSLYLVMAALCLFACSSDKKMESLNQELLEADRAFSDLSQELGMNKAFETYCAEDGVLLRPGRLPIEGKQSIVGLLSEADDTAFDLIWEPTYSLAAESGDMGYTYGIYTMSVKGTDQTMKGTYVSIWIRENGEWKWVLDTGTEGIGE